MLQGRIDGNIAPALSHGDDIDFFACLQVGEIEESPGGEAGGWGGEGGGGGGVEAGDFGHEDHDLVVDVGLLELSGWVEEEKEEEK